MKKHLYVDLYIECFLCRWLVCISTSCSPLQDESHCWHSIEM
jgi:hypothetical protein